MTEKAHHPVSLLFSYGGKGRDKMCNPKILCLLLFMGVHVKAIAFSELKVSNLPGEYNSGKWRLQKLFITVTIIRVKYLRQ